MDELSSLGHELAELVLNSIETKDNKIQIKIIQPTRHSPILSSVYEFKCMSDLELNQLINKQSSNLCHKKNSLSEQMTLRQFVCQFIFLVFFLDNIKQPESRFWILFLRNLLRRILFQLITIKLKEEKEKKTQTTPILPISDNVRVDSSSSTSVLISENKAFNLMSCIEENLEMSSLYKELTRFESTHDVSCIDKYHLELQSFLLGQEFTYITHTFLDDPISTLWKLKVKTIVEKESNDSCCVFTRQLHELLTFYNIPSSDKHIATASFLTKNNEEASSTVSDLLVQRNRLSGKINVERHSLIKDSYFIQIKEARMLEKGQGQIDSADISAEIITKEGIYISQVCANILSFLLNTHLESSELQLLEYKIGCLIPLCLRLLCVPNSQCHMKTLECLLCLIKQKNAQSVLCQLVVPISEALRRHFPIFLEKDQHTKTSFELYLNAYVELIIRTNPSPSSPRATKEVEFLLTRSSLNIIGVPDRLAILLRYCRPLIQHYGIFSSACSAEWMEICLHAIETFDSTVCIESLQMLHLLLVSLPPIFCIPYHIDIVARFILLRKNLVISEQSLIINQEIQLIKTLINNILHAIDADKFKGIDAWDLLDMNAN